MFAFTSFFIVIIAGLLFSGVLKRFHLPWVVALIITGIVIGPHALGITSADSTLVFIGDIGLVFLMFMAGLEIKFSGMRGKAGRGMWVIAVVNGLLPFVLGLFLGRIFDYSWLASLLIGTILMSSSVAVVIPLLERTKLLHQKIGQWIIGSTAIQDIASLVILAAVLRIADPDTAIPLWLFYILAGAAFFIARWLITRAWKLYQWAYHDDGVFELELRGIIAILLGTVIIFELLGMHGIIAGFFAGMVLSDQVTNKKLLEKLHTIAYGVFIPVFFVVVGLQVDLSVFVQAKTLIVFTVLVVGGSIVMKFASGWLGGYLSGLRKMDNNLIGATSMPQLSTTLAATFAGYELGIFNEEMIVVMTILSIVTTFVSPIVIEWIMNTMDASKALLVEEKGVSSKLEGKS